MRGLVGEHRLAYDITNGKDVGDIGAHLAVDGDEAVLVDGDTRGVGPDRMSVGLAADGDEDLIEGVGCWRSAPLEVNDESRGARFDFHHLCLQVNVLIT